MDTISKTEILISGGALITAIGASWYLNNRINELEEHVNGLTDKLAKLINKSANDSGKIDAIATAIKNISENIEKLKKEFKVVIDLEEKRSKILASQSLAINELQSFLKDQFEGADFKHQIVFKKKSKSKTSGHSKKRSEKPPPESSSDSSSDSDESGSEGIMESIRRAKGS